MVSRSSTALVAQVLVPLWWLLVQMIGFVWQNRKKILEALTNTPTYRKSMKVIRKSWKFSKPSSSWSKNPSLNLFLRKGRGDIVVVILLLHLWQKNLLNSEFLKKSFSMLQRYIIIFWKVQKYFYWSEFFSNDKKRVRLEARAKLACILFKYN